MKLKNEQTQEKYWYAHAINLKGQTVIDIYKCAEVKFRMCTQLTNENFTTVMKKFLVVKYIIIKQGIKTAYKLLAT